MVRSSHCVVKELAFGVAALVANVAVIVAADSIVGLTAASVERIVVVAVGFVAVAVLEDVGVAVVAVEEVGMESVFAVVESANIVVDATVGGASYCK